MANNWSASVPTWWAPTVQDFLENDLVSRQVTRMQFGVDLSYGNKVDMQYVTPGRVQTLVPGTDLTIDDSTSTSDQLTINTRIASTFYSDKTEYKQIHPKFTAELAQNCAYALNNRIDQTNINTGISGASSLNTLAGGTLNSSVMLQIATEAYSKLLRNGKLKPKRDRAFLFIDPEREALLQQNASGIGYRVSDEILNGEWMGAGYGGKFYHFDVFCTNNLPYTVSLTMDTQPTDGDTVELLGVTLTFKTTAATAGQIARGANVAASQANFVACVNGTGTGDGTDYVELSDEDRLTFQNAQIAASTFSANVSTITAFGSINADETFTATSNVFSAETSNMLYGKYGSLAAAVQIEPELYIGREPKQVRDNFIQYALFGTKVFYRESFRLGKISFTANPAPTGA